MLRRLRPSRFVRAVTGAALLALGAAACGDKKPAAVPATKPEQAQEPIPDPSTYKPEKSCADREKEVGTQDKLPPANSPVLLRCMELQFHPVNQPLIDYETYAYYIKSKPTLASKDVWSPYNEDQLQEDFWALYRTNFLDNLVIQVIDEPYANGVDAKHVVFHMEERPKLKGVDYTGSKAVDVSKIEEALKKKGLELRLDSFIDEATVRRVKDVIKDLYSEEGYQYASVSSTMAPVSGSQKLDVLTFDISQGPKVRIKQVVFDGAKNFSSGDLAGEMKDNKAVGFLSFITGAGKYQETKFEDDAQRVMDFYHDHGYMAARIGLQQIEPIADSPDGKTRWVRLRIPVDEGQRYKLGNFEITGNQAVRSEFIRTFFKVKSGEWVEWKKVTKGEEKLKEAYGTAGFFHMTPNVDVSFPGTDDKGKIADPATYKPIVNVKVNIVEDKLFRVNRITFTGNTTTHDTVVRRELMGLYEGGVFNVEALKRSVRRLNQLGYFKPIEDNDAVKIEETPNKEGMVDVTLKFEEQNRNQITFGAGVSQIDGFFGQLSFSTANFLGRGESVGVTLQKGSQAKNYTVNFTEPFLFDRPISAGIGLFSREFIFPAQFTQDSTGGNVVIGLPISGFTRFYGGYSYEEDKVPLSGINPLYLTPAALASNPFLRDSLLVDSGGRRTIGKVSPSISYDTVNSPIFPDQGTRLTAAFDFAGVGGNTQFWQSRLEGTWFLRLNPRNSIGLHIQGQWISPFGSTTAIPIFQKLYIGGEYSIRGFDLRSIGPRDPTSGVVIGGNKTIVFNAEYVVNVGGPVRVLWFYDAGEVRDTGQQFRVWDPVSQLIPATPPLLSDPLSNNLLTDPNNPPSVATLKTIGRESAIKTSTGLEVRFFMPVLNVPFRLIFAYNPQRGSVLNNNLVLTKAFVVKFAVGTTF